jgi:hypothetical protein
MHRVAPRSRGLALCLAVVTLVAIAPAAPRAEDTAAARPQLADLMAATQLRQSKLWYAQKARNWDLARYEYKQFRAALARVGDLYPQGDFPALPAGVRDDANRALDDLSTAIEAKNQKRFEAAFQQLNKACNQCHQSAGVGFIKVQTPTRSPYGNQNFAPAAQ